MKFCRRLQFDNVCKIPSGIFYNGRFKGKKNSARPFVEIVEWKTFARFEQKK